MQFRSIGTIGDFDILQIENSPPVQASRLNPDKCKRPAYNNSLNKTAAMPKPGYRLF